MLRPPPFLVPAFVIWVLVMKHVSGWGSGAHSVICDLAFKLLSDSGQDYLLKVIGEAGSSKVTFSFFQEVCEWADSVDWSQDLHFAHTIPDCSDGFDFDRDCGNFGSGRCIVSAIANFTQVVVDIDSSSKERKESMKFLMHLFADIHQPLHIGFREDDGGTRIGITVPSSLLAKHGVNESQSIRSLHDFWDIPLVDIAKTKFLGEGAKKTLKKHKLEFHHLTDKLRIWYEGHRNMYQLSAVNLRNISLDNKEQTIRCDSYGTYLLLSSQLVGHVGSIASETARQYTCRYAYKMDEVTYIVDGDELTNEYLNNGARVVRDQLIKSAVRLANWIESMHAEYKLRKKERKAAFKRAPRLDSSLIETTVSSQKDNIYEYLLTIDFDPNECVTTEDSGAIDQEQAVVHRIPTTTSPLLVIDGIQISKLALYRITSNAFAISYKELFGDGYTTSANVSGLSAYAVTVRSTVRDSNAFQFLLDRRVFRKPIPSRRLARVMFNHFRGLTANKSATTSIADDEHSVPDESFTPSSVNDSSSIETLDFGSLKPALHPLDNKYQSFQPSAITPPEVSANEVAEMNTKFNLLSTVGQLLMIPCLSKDCFLITTKSWITEKYINPSTNVRAFRGMQFVMYPDGDLVSNQTVIIMDTQILSTMPSQFVLMTIAHAIKYSAWMIRESEESNLVIKQLVRDFKAACFVSFGNGDVNKTDLLFVNTRPLPETPSMHGFMWVTQRR